MMEEQDKKRMQALGYFDDFEDVLGEVVNSQGESAFPQMQEY